MDLANPAQRLRWGSTLLDRTRHELRRDGAVVPVQALVYRAIEHFADRPGTVISRDELLDTLWPDTTVSDAALNQLIRKVRRALGPDGDKLTTVRGYGYRLDLEPQAAASQATDGWQRFQQLVEEQPAEHSEIAPEKLEAVARQLDTTEACDRVLDWMATTPTQPGLRRWRPLLRHLHDRFAGNDIRRRTHAALLISRSYSNHERYIERIRVLRPLVAQLAAVSGPDKVQVFRSLAYAEVGRGDFDAAQTYAEGSVQAAAELTDPRQTYRANECAAYVHARAGDANAALRTSEAAQDAAQTWGHAESEVLALGLVAQAHALGGDFVRELAAYEKGLVKARMTGLTTAEMEITGPLGVRYAEHGRVADALRSYKRTLELAQECDDDAWVIVSHVNVANTSLAVRDPDAAAFHLQEAAALDGQYTKLRAMREFVEAHRLLYLGDSAAIEAYQTAARTAAAVPDPSHATTCRAHGALCAAHFGQLDTADRQIEAVLHGPLDHRCRADALLMAGCIALRAGRGEQAGGLFLRLLDALRPEEVLLRAEAMVLRAASGASIDAEALRSLLAQTDSRDLQAAASWLDDPSASVPRALEGAGTEPYTTLVAALGERP